MVMVGGTTLRGSFSQFTYVVAMDNNKDRKQTKTAYFQVKKELTMKLRGIKLHLIILFAVYILKVNLCFQKSFFNLNLREPFEIYKIKCSLMSRNSTHYGNIYTSFLLVCRKEQGGCIHQPFLRTHLLHRQTDS